MTEPNKITLPIFPEDAAAWYGPDLVPCTEDWVHVLTPQEVDDLHSATEAALARGAGLVGLTAAQFALPVLGPVLRGIRRDVLHGRGFVLIRGWPVADCSMAQNAMAFMGLGAHLGEAVSQNGKGHVLGHVADLGMDIKAATTRGYQTNAGLAFHTDGSDVVGLLCLRPAKSGGLTCLTSSTTIWNEIVHRRPDLAEVLLRPLPHSRMGEVPEGKLPYFMLPMFQPHAGRMTATVITGFILKAQKFDAVPPLRPLEKEAIRFVDTLANDDALRLDMDFRPGDMQFVNNHTILHSRTDYEDFDQIEQRRHLLRLWLACDDGPALPPALTTEFQGATAGGRPNGIQLAGVPMTAPLEPQ